MSEPPKVKKINNVSLIENIVIIPSYIYTNTRHFTIEDRCAQTKKTISSIRDNIPNCYIILAELSVPTVDEINELNPDCIIFFITEALRLGHLDYTDKDRGEVFLITSCLQYIAGNVDVSNLKQIFKITGRFHINSHFDINAFDTKKLTFCTNSRHNTLMFGIGKEKLNDAYNFLMNFYANNFYGLGFEACMYHSLNENKDSISLIPRIGCSGYSSLTGEEIDC